MALPPSLTVIRSSVVALVVAVGVSAGTLVASTGGSVSARSITTASFQGVTAGQPDIILILTDDQRFDTLWAMPTVRSQLVAKGVSFSNGYVSNPVCCPSRSSTLTGQYSHTTRVYTNHPKEPFGGSPVKLLVTPGSASSPSTSRTLCSHCACVRRTTRDRTGVPSSATPGSASPALSGFCASGGGRNISPSVMVPLQANAPTSSAANETVRRMRLLFE